MLWCWAPRLQTEIAKRHSAAVLGADREARVIFLAPTVNLADQQAGAQHSCTRSSSGCAGLNVAGGGAGWKKAVGPAHKGCRPDT